MTGEAFRDEGIERVDRSAPEDWKDAADAVINALAAGGREFSAEDLRAWVGDPPHPNALGARFMAAIKSRRIQRVGWKHATRAEAHARALAVYRGAIHA